MTTLEQLNAKGVKIKNAPKMQLLQIQELTPPKKQRGRGTNDLEHRMLLYLRSRPEIEQITEHPESFPIGFRCTYQPDALAFNKREKCWEVWEAKNAWVMQKDDGGLVKIKAMAQSFDNYEMCGFPKYIKGFWRIYCNINFYIFEEGKDRQIWIRQITTIGQPCKKKIKLSEIIK